MDKNYYFFFCKQKLLVLNTIKVKMTKKKKKVEGLDNWVIIESHNWYIFIFLPNVTISNLYYFIF